MDRPVSCEQTVTCDCVGGIQTEQTKQGNMEPEAPSPPTCSRPRLVLLATCLTLAVSCSAILAWQLAPTSPPPLLPGPYIRLRAVYGEPFGHGWGGTGVGDKSVLMLYCRCGHPWLWTYIELFQPSGSAPIIT